MAAGDCGKGRGEGETHKHAAVRAGPSDHRSLTPKCFSGQASSWSRSLSIHDGDDEDNAADDLSNDDENVPDCTEPHSVYCRDKQHS